MRKLHRESEKLFYNGKLRHIYITMQIADGVPLVTVAGRAGHARTSITTNIYSHFLKSSDRTAAKKIEELFD